MFIPETEAIREGYERRYDELVPILDELGTPFPGNLGNRRVDPFGKVTCQEFLDVLDDLLHLGDQEVCLSI